MEIRPPFVALPTPPSPTRRDTRISGTEPAAERPEQRPAGSGGLTEYISQGELLDEAGNSDYRDLIRAARQQRINPSPAGQPGTATAYVSRALTAYQDNSSAALEDRPPPRFDHKV